MKVTSNPTLDAEGWEISSRCNNCGARNSNITIADIFVDEHNNHFYKCGFCSEHKQLNVPKFVKYEISKKPERKVRSKRGSGYYLFIFTFGCAFAISVIGCAKAIEAGNRDLAKGGLISASFLGVVWGGVIVSKDL